MKLFLNFSQIKKNGRIVDDNTYRLKMAKKEHQKHVRDLLATAIVHKALDVEVAIYFVPLPIEIVWENENIPNRT